MTELNKADIEAIHSIISRKAITQDGKAGMIVERWLGDKVLLLKCVALVAFDIREAAEALLADVHKRYPGEPLRCPHMIALETAVKAAQSIA